MGDSRLQIIARSGCAFARALLREDRGQATLEYVLILSFAVGAAGVMTRVLLNALDDGVLTLGAELEKNLKTGRARPSVFSN